MIPILGGLVDIAKGFISGSQEKQKLRLELELERMRVSAKAESAPADYDMAAMQNQEHSWKDEILMAVWVIPVIMGFVPQLQPYVSIGWDCLNKAPWWYSSLLIGITASVYGLRWYFGTKKFDYFTSKTLPTISEPLE